MGNWSFDVLQPSLVEQELTQRDQFNNDEVGLSEALVREVIQNSTDAAVNGETVRVSFRLHSLSDEDAPQLSGLFKTLRPHLEACGISTAPLNAPSPRLLVIEDFNTRGLTGNPTELDDDNFRNFWRRHGRSGKAGRAGGRWGLGKLVFSSSSQIRSFFGLTVRFGETNALLMGQAVLSNHQIDGVRHPAHGFWCAGRAPNTLQLPLSDPAKIAPIKRLLRITRNKESGLSLVIPYTNGDIKESSIIESVLRNYYFPILAGKLVVEIGATLIDRTTFHKVATSVASLGVPVDFIEEVSGFLEKPKLVLQKPLNDGPGIQKHHFAGDHIEKLKTGYSRGGMIAVRAPIRLSRKDGGEVESFIDLYLKLLPEGGKPFALFARGSITVPGEVRYFSGVPALGAMVAVDDGIVSFLGDAENPAHTAWNATAEKLTSRWRNAAQTLRVVRGALRDLYQQIAEQIEQEDKDALVDFFSVADPSRKGSTGKKKLIPVPDPKIPPREKAILIRPRDGGFSVSAGPGAAQWRYPRYIDIRAAYDIVGGDPFKRHSKFDFDLSGREIKISLQDCEAVQAAANKIRIAVKGPDFKAELSGFDPNRDIVVTARLVS